MANSSLTIVPATPDDVPAIQSMVQTAYSKYIDRIGQPPAPMKADYYQILTTHDVFVLKADSQTLGSIVLRTEADSVQINNLVVDPAAQGRGYGRLLMAHAEERARSQNRPALTLYTNVKMHENLALYPKMGFVELERRSEDGYDRAFFRKELD